MRSYRWEDWSAADLLGLKGSTRVSVVLPARDEEATVGSIVEVLRRELVVAVPLIDELVVIDSDSTDRTAAVAAEAGASVYAAASIERSLGHYPGKGEALWKSQFVTTGDVVVFVDSDLVEWGPHFVTGLLGPLLTEPSVALVKAMYDRPMIDADGHEEEAGGRVTELVARPLLALHCPALRDVVQPLSGEWAIRRSVLETFSVPVGYGVEIAALIDAATESGADTVAQVDLGRRTHRHHRHDTLGQMALQVLAAVEARVPGGREVFASPRDEIALRQFAGAATGFAARDATVLVLERPPALSIPSYAGTRAAPMGDAAQ